MPRQHGADILKLRWHRFREDLVTRRVSLEVALFERQNRGRIVGSAEPSSVSPDKSTIAPKQSLNTRVMPEKNPGVRGLAPECADPNH